MTVVREQKAIFNIAPDTLAMKLEDVLRSNRLYQNVELGPDGHAFTVLIKPGFPLLPTRMKMQVVPDGAHTILKVQTISQWYILGDIANMYNQYIVDLCAAVRQAGSHGLLRASSAPRMIAETLLRPAEESATSGEELLRATEKRGS